MRITYKLVVENEGKVTEEEFETNEAMVEKAKTYDPTYTPPKEGWRIRFMRYLFGKRSG
jgi:hypothetical protein